MIYAWNQCVEPKQISNVKKKNFVWKLKCDFKLISFFNSFICILITQYFLFRGFSERNLTKFKLCVNFSRAEMGKRQNKKKSEASQQ